MVIIYFLMALVGAAAAIFALQNVDPVVIRFLGWRVEGMPVALVILLSAFIGIVFAALSGFAQQWRLRSRVRQLESQVAQLSATEVPRGAQRPSDDSAKL